MLQKTNIPQEANILLLPVHFHLSDVASDVESALAVKEILNEVFMSYLLRVDHGGEFSFDHKDQIYMLNQSLQKVLDLMITQTTH